MCCDRIHSWEIIFLVTLYFNLTNKKWVLLKITILGRHFYRTHIQDFIHAFLQKTHLMWPKLYSVSAPWYWRLSVHSQLLICMFCYWSHSPGVYRVETRLFFSGHLVSVCGVDKSIRHRLYISTRKSRDQQMVGCILFPSCRRWFQREKWIFLT